MFAEKKEIPGQSLVFAAALLRLAWPTPARLELLVGDKIIAYVDKGFVGVANVIEAQWSGSHV